MRNDLIESICIGGCIGLVVLAIHALTSNAGPQTQLLALLVAAILIVCGQLVFTIWRRRRGAALLDQPHHQAPNLLQIRRNRRNPFFRELTSDWTGLDERFLEPGADGSTPPARPSDHSDGEHNDNRQQ